MYEAEQPKAEADPILLTAIAKGIDKLIGKAKPPQGSHPINATATVQVSGCVEKSADYAAIRKPKYSLPILVAMLGRMANWSRSAAKKNLAEALAESIDWQRKVDEAEAAKSAPPEIASTLKDRMVDADETICIVNGNHAETATNSGACKFVGRVTVSVKSMLAILCLLAVSAAAPAIDAGGPTNHGETITVHLADSQHQHNISVRGLGCCVFRSIDHAARYQQIDALVHMPEWMRDKGIAGGGWPEKVTELIPRIAADRGLPTPEYIQHNGGDLEFLRLALRTGRYVSVTYSGRDGVFYRVPISHMVNLVHLSDQWAVIMDNNNPGKYLWMSVADFKSRWSGWAVVLLGSPPPPIPKN